jgi:hypothetical protein
MPLSWGDRWDELVANAVAIYIVNDRKPNREELKSIRTLLRRAVHVLDQDIAAGAVGELR